MGRSKALRLNWILAACSEADLEKAGLLVARELGFRHLMFHGCFSWGGTNQDIHFDNFPVSWRRYCAARGRDLLPAPLRRLALQEVTPLLWARVSLEHMRSFAKAAEHGLGTGASCPVRGPHGQWSLTSFVLARSGPSAERRTVGALPDCQLVACAMHCAAARLARRSASPPRRIGGSPNGVLSDREYQCLIESARGKTTAEIGHALQISERTVAFHLANLRRKLGAANSRHAVTKAISLKLIAAGP
ncbi:MAG TPA: LuxR C-terminal-related transcriptional regulator [Burkholderiales bacterium]|nr:LuxR C-terminal-related transcriptional regulator [Burkholderiales bacterium]